MMTNVLRFWLVATVAIGLGSEARAQSDWGSLNPPGIRSLTYADGQFVGVGDYGAVISSKNGQYWGIKARGTADWFDVKNYGGKWIIVGRNGAVNISSDAKTWSSANTGLSEDLYRVGGFNGTYVAGTAAGSVLTSPDGITWTVRYKVYGAGPIFGIASGNGRCVALPQYGGVNISTDGVQWTHSGVTGLAMYSTELAFGNGLFVVVGESGKICTSPDGLSWTSRTSTTTNTIYGVVFKEGQFVAPTGGGLVLTSPDGITWIQRSTGTTNNLNCMAFGNGRWVGFDQANYYTTPVTSKDAATWTSAPRAVSSILRGVVFAQNRYVAVGDGGNILTSDNGSTWTARSSGITRDLYTVIYAGGRFVAGGSNGEILTSADGITWTRRTSVAAGTITKIAYANGRYVGIYGTSGGNLLSVDGVTWTINNPIFSISTTIYGIASDGSKFLAVGNGDAYTSTDATSWTKVRGTSTDAAFAVTFGAGKFVIAGTVGRIWTTTDGATWTLRATNSTSDLYGIDYAGGYFMACGREGVLTLSGDGVNWTTTQDGPNGTRLQTLRDTYAGPGLLIAVGDAGGIETCRMRTGYPYSAWKEDYFTTDELAQESQVAATAADDISSGDGISNRLKYAFGLAPHETASLSSLISPILFVDADGAHPVVQFKRSRDAASSLNFRLEWSSSLTSPDWQTVVTTPSVVSSSTSIEALQVQDPAVLDTTPRFYRVKVDFGSQLSQ